MVILMGDSETDTICIEQRVEVAGYHGTVMYIGEVPPAKGVWLGVDWDDHSRGKHDGVYHGIRYFTASHPTSGSFVRREKVNTGRSCVTAIIERYGLNNEAMNKENLQLLKRAINASLLEMVGFEKINKKQSCFSALTMVWLRDHCVSHAGEPGELAEMVPNIKEIDLSHNLLPSWQKLAEITEQLPLLRLLNISDNRLQIPENPEEYRFAFSRLSHLVMARVRYNWAQIISCSYMWPNITNIQVPFNYITSLDTFPEGILENLESLDLEGNVIRNWKEINKLGRLPRLKNLNLVGTEMSDISLPSTGSLFPSLRNLLLSENNISKWEYVSELDKLCSLEELRFTQNPVLEGCSRETARQIVIARIAKLKVLNRQVITGEERRGAEYDYIKNNGKAWLDSAKSENLRLEFLSKHPRYPVLVKIYGAAEESEFAVKSTSLKSTLVTLQLCSRDKTIVKKLPRSMLVTRLVSLVQRLFNTENAVPSLSCRSAKIPDVEVQMDNVLKPLDFYSVEDEDKILINW